MDRTRLCEIMQLPDDVVSMQDLLIIQRLSDKYPYSNLFKVLQAKFAVLLKNYNSEDCLHEAAVYVSDREYFKHIIATLNQHRPVVDEHKEDKEDMSLKDIDLQEDISLKVDKSIRQSAKKEFKIVTETMAKVYAKQGDKNRAIEIYRQLIIRNPKKSIYYTNKIEDLKNNSY